MSDEAKWYTAGLDVWKKWDEHNNFCNTQWRLRKMTSFVITKPRFAFIFCFYNIKARLGDQKYNKKP